MTRKRTPVRRAFSYLELLLVMVTIGFVAGMAVPRYSRSLWRYRALATAQRVVSDVTYAAADARASSSRRTVTFDLAANACHIDELRDMDRGDRKWTLRFGEEPYVATLVSADLGGDAVLVFDGYGAPDSGGTIVVRAGDATRRITIDPVTGRAKVE